MAATNFTPIILYHSTTASAAPTAGNLNNGELAINITDGKLFYKDNGGVVQVIATKGTGVIGGSDTQVQYNSSGALAGSANFTFNGTTASINTLNLTTALAAAYGGTGQSSYTTGDIIYATGATALSKLTIGANTTILTSNGSAPQWSAASAISVNTATNLAGGAAGSLPYQSGAGATTFLSIGSTNRVLTSSGSAPQWVTALSDLTGVSSNIATLGGSGFTLPAVLSVTAPAKLYINTSTVTDGSSAIGATNTLGAITSFGGTTVAATNANVTYTNLGTLVINAAPTAGTNVTITNPYALYVAAGASYFGSTVTVNGTVNATTLDLTNLEVTNIKAKDGTAAMSIADSTGVVSITVNPILSGGTANGVVYLNASKVATTGSALTFDGTKFQVGGSGEPGKMSLFLNDTKTYSSATGVDTDLFVVRVNSSITNNQTASLQLVASGNAGTNAGRATISVIQDTAITSSGHLAFQTNSAGTTSEKVRITSTGTLNIVGAGTAGSTQAISFNGSTPVDTLVTTSGGLVGIGTSSPGYKLTVAATASTAAYITGTGAVTTLDLDNTNANAWGGNIAIRTGGTAAGYFGTVGSLVGSTSQNIAIWATASKGINFYTDNSSTAKAVLDASGNLGLGVTPKTDWSTDYKAMQFGASGALSSHTSTSLNFTILATNQYINSAGTSKFINDGYAPRYLLRGDTGEHYWYTTNTSTAGQNVTNTQAMTLDASGNLAIGVTSAPSRVTVAQGTTPTDFSTVAVMVGGTGADSYAVGAFHNIGFLYDPTSSAKPAVAIGHVITSDAGATKGALVFATRDVTTDTAPTERARITSGGEFIVGFGTNSVATVKTGAAIGFTNTANTSSFDVGLLGGSSDATAYVYQRANSAMVFGTNNTERARITSGGDLLVGTTNAANANAKIRSSSGIEYSNSVLFNVQNPNGKVFTVTGGSNGSSTFVEIEVLTYEGYFKAVYFCINSSGSWENDKYNEVTSGTPATVTVAGNNTATITFTVACTTSFTPLMRVAMGNQYASMA